MADLKGRRVGHIGGEGFLYTLRKALARAGVDPETVTFVDLPGGDPLTALLEGRIDAFGTTEPIPTIALRNFPELASVGLEEVPFYLVLPKRVLVERRDVALQILAAEVRAFFWLKASGKNLHQAGIWVRQEQERVLLPGLSIDLFDYDRLATRTITDVESFVGVLQRARLQDDELKVRFQFARESRLIPADTPDEKFGSLLHLGVLEQVMSSPERYELRTPVVARRPFQEERARRD